ncbi:poly(A) RNA polymerase GLD2 [Denticeps clupeoides]|nr:poly(A) RNA polymerase GLD2 [Denticeps clupeoides]
MYHRSAGFPHQHGQEGGAVHPVPASPYFSPQRVLETQLNRANAISNGNPLHSCFPVISTYQWNPASHTPLLYHGSPSPSTSRKRRPDEQGQHDLKRQRFSSPVPLSTEPGTPAAPQAEPVARPAGPREILSPSTPRSAGCVPSLREDPRQPNLTSRLLSSTKDKLSQQILELFQSCEQQSEDLEKKELCRAQLQTDIQRIFPCSRVYLAGSSLNGFGSRTSDADLCLVINEGSVSKKAHAVHVLSRVQKLFHSLSYIQRPQLIQAKVPILKFKDKFSGVEFDLNVNNIVGIRNTFLLRTYAYIENRVRPIVLVIKKWAKFNGINDASHGTLSSYTLVLMVLHYLQTLPAPVIPCLQMDYPECFDPLMDIHCVPNGSRNIPGFISMNQSSLGELVLGFLKYYATTFKWDKYVISVRQATVFPKPYMKEWRNKFICVEEPFDGTNTARAVHQKVKFEAIKAQFFESWRLLQLRKDLNFLLPLGQTRPKR